MRLQKSILVSAVVAGLSLLLWVALFHSLYSLLGPEVVGKWALLSAILGISRVAECGTGVAVARLVAARRPLEPTAGTWIVGAVLLVTGAGIVSVGMVSVIFGVFRPEFFSDPRVDGLLAYACIFTAFTSILMSPLRGGLDGLQKIETRQLASLVQPAILLVSSLATIPLYGERGFALSLGISSLLPLMLYGWFLWRALPIGDRHVGLMSPAVRGLLKVGLPLQAGYACQYLFEPLTKALLERYSGLGAVANFEMVNRLVVQIRGLLITAMEPLVPYFAKAASENPLDSERSYKMSRQITAVFAGPVFSVSMFILPMMSQVVTGVVNPRIVFIGVLLSLAWLVNTLSAPAYLYFISTGRQWKALLGQVIIAACNLMLGAIGGLLWGDSGVVVAWVVSLCIGSMWIVLDHTASPSSVLRCFAFMRKPLQLGILAAAAVVSLTLMEIELIWQTVFLGVWTVVLVMNLLRQEEIRAVAAAVMRRLWPREA